MMDPLKIETNPITSPPDRVELELRLRKVQRIMKAAGLDYYIAARMENVYYLTHFGHVPLERPFFSVVPQAGNPELVIPSVETHVKSEFSDYLKIHIYDETEYPAPPGEGYRGVLAELTPPGAQVGVETSFPLSLRDCVRGTIVVNDVIEEARVVKTQYEIGRICYAARIATVGIKAILGMAREGASALELKTGMNDAAMKFYYFDVPDNNPFSINVTPDWSGVWVGARGAQPHGGPHPSDRLQKHVPNICNCLVQVDQYASECERTFFIGQPENWSVERFKVVKEARDLGLAMIKEGVACCEIDEKVLAYMVKRGYEEQIHRSGHGIGLQVHERPWVAMASKEILKENMVISMEPAIFYPGEGGFRHSDTVRVTREGSEILSQPYQPTELESLIL